MPYAFPPHLQSIVDSVPDEIRTQLTNAELLARATEVDRLEKQARAQSIPDNYDLLSRRAWRVLRAIPPAELAKQVQALMVKAADAPTGLRIGYNDRARQLQDDNPQVDAAAVKDAKEIVKAAKVQARKFKGKGKGAGKAVAAPVVLLKRAG